MSSTELVSLLRSFVSSVTARSRSHGVFTLVVVLGVLGIASSARADRAVLFPVQGSADPDRLEAVEDALAAALTRVGHTRVATPGGIAATRPSTAAQMDGIATSSGASYVVLPDIETMPGQYRLHVVVGYEGRVEELLVNVTYADEAARLDDVLRSMLRPAGLGDDALRLAGIESDADRARREAEEAARRADEEARRRAEEDQRMAEMRAEEERQAAQRAEEEAQRRRAEEEAAQRAEAERQATAQSAWNARPRPGHDGRWIAMVGVLGGGLAPLGTSGPSSSGTVRPPSGLVGVAVLQARVGHTLEAVEGLTLRGGLDITLGGTSGVGILVGGSYQLSPFTFPLHLGAVLEVGLNFLVTGPRDAGFVGRLSAIASYELVDHVTLEVSLPELAYVSNGPGAIGFGASARLGYRF